MTFKQFFQLVSYIQYPLMAVALFFAFKPYFSGLDAIRENPTIYFENMNKMLMFLGLGVSFSSLQDTTKTQNKLSLKIYEDPKKGKIFLLSIVIMITFLLGSGLLLFFSFEDSAINQLSTGMIILGLGMFGFLKAGAEMFENHRLDKKKNTHEKK